MLAIKQYSDDDLAEFAGRVFRLGLIDGRNQSRPRDSYDVMRAIGTMQDNWRKIDRMKFRQVYGAGFDISRLLVTNPTP